MNSNKVGKFILNLRKDNNLTQSEFAEMFGVTYQAVSKWENGKNIPDLLTLKEICEKFNLDINEILDGKKGQKSKRNIIYTIIGIMAIILISGGLYFFLRTDSDFQFKTISSNCDNFTINGSIAFNNNRSHIYISNIEYCGGDDKTEYVKIECILYESYGNIERTIDSVTKESEEGMLLEDFLRDVTFHVDNFEVACREFRESTLFLQILATDRDGRVISHRIPLNHHASCPND